MGEWVAGCYLETMPLCGPSYKLSLSRFSARPKFQDEPSVAICYEPDELFNADEYKDAEKID